MSVVNINAVSIRYVAFVIVITDDGGVQIHPLAISSQNDTPFDSVLVGNGVFAVSHDEQSMERASSGWHEDKPVAWMEAVLLGNRHRLHGVGVTPALHVYSCFQTIPVTRSGRGIAIQWVHSHRVEQSASQPGRALKLQTDGIARLLNASNRNSAIVLA